MATTVSQTLNSPPPPIVTLLSQPGNYFYHVLRVSGEATYNVSLQTIQLDTAGNSLGSAKVLSTASTSEFVGGIDTDDFYSFTAAVPGEAAATISGATSPGVSVEIIRDANNNGVIDPGETLATTTGTTALNDQLAGVFLPVAGTYYAHVVGNGAGSNYTLGLTVDTQTPFSGVPFVVDPTVPVGVTIQAEDFDKGGEGVSYHDTTPGSNAGGVYRTSENGAAVGVDIFPTADSGGGFKVDSTSAGEFLEYSINVLTSGSYNISFRAGTTGTGARFHAEVDGVNVTGPKDVPGNLPADNFATVLASNVALTAGPHVLRLVMDQNNSTSPTSAGAFNFINIAPSTGTFVLTAPAKARVGQLVNLGLQWTVPVGTWHSLDQIDIRISDSHGIVVIVRFDIDDQTVSLYNARSKKFGPAKKIGGHGVLANDDVEIDLSSSSIVGAGPTAPSVSINLGLRFLQTDFRRDDFTIDVAASNDSGFSQAFEHAGQILLKGLPRHRLWHGKF
jgi:hypothetical protein